MYKAFFGFAKNPFNMSPDPSFLFRSAQHEEALANLIYGVQSRKGFIVLTGEVGTRQDHHAGMPARLPQRATDRVLLSLF